MTHENILAHQLNVMLDLQDQMNTRVNPAWRQQGYEWYRAIWVECAELMDHYGWKWWKKQTPDTEQVALELIDIWHFGLSLLLQSGRPREAILEHIQRELSIPAFEKNFRLDVETFVAKTLGDRQFHIDLFARLMADVDMTFDQLYRGYVGKNVLNFFRQDHGYQEGSYRKRWHDGREDNEHLVEILQTLNSNDPGFQEDLYGALREKYGQ